MYILSCFRAFKSRPELTQAVADILQLLGTAMVDVTETTGYNLEMVEGELGAMLDVIASEGVDYFEEARENIQRQETNSQSMELADAQEQVSLVFCLYLKRNIILYAPVKHTLIHYNQKFHSKYV